MDDRMIGPQHGPVGVTKDSAPAVALQIAEFLARTELERLELFRLHLQTTVLRVSPLLIDIAALEGIELAGALSLISPPQNWPRRPLNDFPPGHRNSQRAKIWLRAVGSRDAWYFDKTFAAPGVVIRKINHPNGRFAIRPCGSVLGFTAEIGPCVLSAFGTTAVLKLSEAVPETIMASMPGRLIGNVVDHPIFAGRNYVIGSATADLYDGLPVFTFDATLLPFPGPCASHTRGN